MELMGDLKDKVSKAKDKEEARGLIEKAGMKLTDTELEMVAGGVATDFYPNLRKLMDSVINVIKSRKEQSDFGLAVLFL